MKFDDLQAQADRIRLLEEEIFALKAGRQSGVAAPVVRLARDINVTKRAQISAGAKTKLLAGKSLLYVSGGEIPDRADEIARWFGATLRIADPDAGAVSTADCVLCPLRALSERDRANLRRCCRQTGTPLMALRNPSRACFRNAVLKFVDACNQESGEADA